MGDADEDGVDLDLLREAARDFLSGRVAQDSVKELAAMDWTGLLVEEKLGGSGWRPVETTVIAEELGRALNSSTWFGCVLSAAALASAPGETARPMVARDARRDRDGRLRAVRRHRSGGVRRCNRHLGHAGAQGNPSFRGIGNAMPRSRDDELLDVSRAAWRVDISEARERADRWARTSGSAARGREGSAQRGLAGSLRDHIRAADRLSEGAHRFRCADREFPSGATPAGGSVGLRGEGTRGHHEGRPCLEADEISDDAIALSAAAHAFVAAKATAAVDECMQLSGGIGFTWEYPLHHELRRVFTNGYLLGTARSSSCASRGEVGLVSAAPTRPSEAQLTEFRHRVRAHIAEHAPPFDAREGHRAPESPEQEALLRGWFATLFDAGFVGADWPVEHGGRADHHPLHDRIVSEEILRARAPRPIDQVNLAAHVLLHFGSDEQKAELLPPMRRSEHVWCQLLSEPDAGSDIAAVRSRGFDGT